MPTPIYNLRLDPETKARWQAAANEFEMSLSAWIRSACDAFSRGGVIVDPERVDPLTPKRKQFSGPRVFGADSEPTKKRR